MKPHVSRSLSSLSAWVFGLATSVLLISIWGRAVVVDADELSSNLRPISQSEEVSGRFTDWMAQQLVESGIPEEQAESAAEVSVTLPTVENAIGNLVEDVVLAAASPDPGPRAVDVSGALAPAVPDVTRAVVAAGVPVTEEQVGAVVSGLDPLVIRQPGEPPVIGQASPVAGKLAVATVVALAAQVVFGSIYVLLGENRLNAAKTLFTRFALGGISFAVLLKLGSWVADPEGGRAPVSQSISLVADSKWALPAVLGVGAGVAAVFFWMARISSTRAGTKPAAIQAEATPSRVSAAKRRAG